MNDFTHVPQETMAGSMQLITFHVGDLRIGVELDHMKEVSRDLDIIPSQHSWEHVSGTVLWRGEMLPVIDLGKLFFQRCMEVSRKSRNLIISIDGKQFGLLVDHVEDIQEVAPEQMNSLADNRTGLQCQYFKGICQQDTNTVMILDVEKISNQLQSLAGPTFLRQQASRREFV